MKHPRLARFEQNLTNSGKDFTSRYLCLWDDSVWKGGIKRAMPFTKNLDILPHSGTVVIALQNRESPTLMSLKLLERRIKLVFPWGIGHMLSGAATFALMQEERDCKFSLVTSLQNARCSDWLSLVLCFFFFFPLVPLLWKTSSAVQVK